MRLHKWLYENKISVVDFAKRLGISRIHMDAIANDRRKAGIRLARDIESATAGQVTEKELRSVEIRRSK